MLAIYKSMTYTICMAPKEIKAWREQNNYSQSQLANALHVHVMTISQWEREIRQIPSFLYLALKCLKKRKGGESKKRDMKKRKEKS